MPEHGAAKASFIIPFDASTGAAAFRRGDEAWLVFDGRRPIDLKGLSSAPLWSEAVVELLPSATLIRLKLSIPRRLRLDRQVEGWMVQVADEDQSGPAQMPSMDATRLLFATIQPGRVVAVPDPATGRNLLVGTLQANGPGVPS